ncbi:unnamed protein product [Schistosoma mattheei]|uniref:Uncharacterized protein n=1 Tax=Schistosoma mattheei TaxID=31246 RepID=A0AA85B0J8_9TREM|nr:unnamed protein product [Schistosoma mattheei]
MSLSSDTSFLVNVNGDFTFPSTAVRCLMGPVAALTTLTHSSSSVLLLSVLPPSFFLQAKANRPIASCISTFLSVQQNIQSQCELGFEHLL